jgi:hypothetical protein
MKTTLGIERKKMGIERRKNLGMERKKTCERKQCAERKTLKENTNFEPKKTALKPVPMWST